MNKCGIYKIENLKNRKKYIGQSINIEKRWKHHINIAFNSKNKNYNNALYCAFRKYGVDSFKFTIIELCDKSNLNEREKYWIAFYNSFKNGYNSTNGGGCFEWDGASKQELYDKIIELNLMYQMKTAAFF